jgi:hypothetical protein
MALDRGHLQKELGIVTTGGTQGHSQSRGGEEDGG